MGRTLLRGAVVHSRVWLPLLLAATVLPAAGITEPVQVTGYFVEDGATTGHYLVKDIAASGAASMLNTLDYAFGRVANRRCEIDNEDTALKHAYRALESVDGVADTPAPGQLRGTFHQLQELKQRYPGLKVLISLGGWGGSGGFSKAAEPDHVRDFVSSCVEKFIRGRFAAGIEAPGIFDGIDIDWEYPVAGALARGRPEDKQRLTAMLAEFRRQLDAIRPGLLLTAALPAREADYRYFELAKISAYLDAISLMAYDLHWDTERMTSFHSALFHDPADPSPPPLDQYFGDYAVQAFLRAGVPARKLLLGVPFYGKAWTSVSQQNHGLYQAGKKGREDSGSYRQLQALPASADRQYNPQAGTCSVWYKNDFWSYDCPEAMRAKVKYVREHDLRGVMFWELSQDTADSELLRTLTGK
ncbi:MAG: glycosyl hydrolase family 18 protein [Terriglobales bacterium]|jgi:chitinase